MGVPALRTDRGRDLDCVGHGKGVTRRRIMRDLSEKWELEINERVAVLYGL